MEEARLELVEWMGERARLKNALQHHRKRSEELQKSLEKGKAEQEGLARKLQEMNVTGSSLEREIRELEEALGQLRARREEIKEKLSRMQAQREELRARLQDLGSSIQRLGSRMQALQGLQLDLAGFSDGIRALREAARTGEIHLGNSLPKVVAEVVDASDGADGLVSALLGDRIQYLVVENWEQALRGLTFAKEKGLGRVGFVALEACGKASLEANSKDESRLGLSWEPGYERLGGLFLEGATLVDTVQEAINRRLSGIKGRLVTSQGDLLDSRGFLEGGDPRDPSKAYLARRRELKDLEASLKKLEEEGRELAAQEIELSRGVSVLSSEQDGLVDLIHAKELRLAECRRDFLSSKEAAGGLKQRLEALKWQMGGQAEELGLAV